MQPPIRGRERRPPDEYGHHSEGSQGSDRAQGQQLLAEAGSPHRQRQDQQVDRQHHHQGNAAEGDAPAGECGEPLNRSNGEGNERPGQVGNHLPERLPEHPQQHRQPAQDHHRRLGRQYNGVGKDGNQRDALEVVSDDGQGHHLGRQGEEQVAANRPGDAPRRGQGQAAGEQVREPGLQRLSVQHQPERGGKGKLETRIPEDIGIEPGHHRGRDRQRVDACLAAQLPGEERKDSP